MPNISQWAPAGLHSTQAGGRMVSGAPAGFANLTVANVGLASNLRLLQGDVLAPSPLPQSIHVRNRGSDGYVADFLFDSAPNDFTIGFEVYDGDLSGFLNQETALILGEWDMFSEGGAVDFRDSMWLFSRRAISKEAGSTETGYENLLVLSSSGRLEPGNMEWQGVGAVNAVATASPVQKTHLGTTTLAAFGKASIYTIRWFSEFPCSICAFVGNNVLAEVPLGFTPISTAKTKAYNFATGAAITVSSVNTTTDTATLSAAPASAVPVVIVYESSDL